MNRRYSTLALASALLALAACNDSDVLSMRDDALIMRQVENISCANGNSVSQAMLGRFLKAKGLAGKTKSVVPLVREGDTLAYSVALQKGWMLVSADARVSPMLMFADNGELNMLDTESPTTQNVLGLLDWLQEIRHKDIATQDYTWGFFATPKSQNSSKKSVVKRRSAYGQGMWIPVDTTYVTETEEIPHIIKSDWDQDFPYNTYTPYAKNSKGVWNQTPLGCAPVACGQIVAHYRTKNSKGIIIPMLARIPTYEDPTFEAYNFSESAWSEIYEDEIINDVRNIFLRYIGSQLGTRYALSGSATKLSNVKKVLNAYKLSVKESEKYDVDIIISDLKCHSPVYISSYIYNDSTGKEEDGGHSYIIDGGRIIDDRLVVNYVWDDEHVITEEEFNRCEQWMFDQGVYGDKEKQVNLSGNTQTYILMNWGYGAKYNNTFYLAKTYSIGGEDFAGSYPSVTTVYEPHWEIKNMGYTAIKVRKMLYDITDN